MTPSWSMHRLAALLRVDALSITRDPVMGFGIVFSLVPALLVPFFRADMNAAALSAFGLADIARYVGATALALPAFMIGWITGFLLIEDRDDRVLNALDVSPLGKRGFFAYRIGLCALVTVGVTLGCAPSLAPTHTLAHWLAIALIGAVTAPTIAMALPAFARNKVEGLALTKLVNLMLLSPLLPALPGPWRFGAGILSPFWIGEIMGLARAPLPLAVAWPLGLAIGLAVFLALFAIAVRRLG